MSDLDRLLSQTRARRRLPRPEVRRAIREQCLLSQADIARELGVTRVTVTRWEGGRRTPRGKKLAAYVALLEQLASEAVSQ